MTDNIQEMTAAEMLLNARTNGRRKREVSTIAKQLCIREEYLTALENGDYGSIPELVYILGFARNYAMELGLDPDEIVAKIKQELNIVEEGAPAPEKDGEESAASGVKSIGKLSRWFEKASKYVYKHWKWFVAGAVALIILIVGICWLSSLGGETPETGDTVEVVTTSKNEPEYRHSVREKFGTENAEKAEIILQAASESWVKIEDARGNTVFSRVLVPGDVYYVPAGSKYKATFGNAGGVDVWVNGKLAPKQGAMNARKANIQLTVEGLFPAPTPVTE